MKKDNEKHSEQYLGDWRDFFWNQDFLELMAKRWKLENVSKVLDVGCGQGHWTQKLLSILPAEAHIVGVDREKEWIQKAQKRFEEQGLSDRVSFKIAEAETFPFPDNSFDMVSCQTLLMHVADVKVVLKEMKRVLKSGGLLAVAEPNNIASNMMADSVNENWSVEQFLELAKFELMRESGKRNLNEGNDSIGSLLMKPLMEVGFKEIQAYISDKVIPFYPPYDTKEQKINVAQMRVWHQNKVVAGTREELERYYLAAGGKKENFEQYWQRGFDFRQKIIDAFDEGNYFSLNTCIFYLISGRKP